NYDAVRWLRRDRPRKAKAARPISGRARTAPSRETPHWRAAAAAGIRTRNANWGSIIIGASAYLIRLAWASSLNPTKNSADIGHPITLSAPLSCFKGFTPVTRRRRAATMFCTGLSALGSSRAYCDRGRAARRYTPPPHSVSIALECVRKSVKRFPDKDAR